ncbi:hypothetical protein PROFUN_08887 [Planoprotostelium fungivorum]|uniref:Uncharacterized protein n=1 Tax=Planoprotostelium fungivorum TaxID=1890364 RepID=A0A2P6NIS5_9EUKA|nr:hypothetical protein PROFUN_08887 [Planoprotostelium fungivorum]
MAETALPKVDPNINWEHEYCVHDMIYGSRRSARKTAKVTAFARLGFSYDLEGGCGASSSDSISKDMQRMKKDYGASFIRIYLTKCRDVSVYKDLVKAVETTTCGCHPYDLLGFWSQRQACGESTLGRLEDAELGKIAPYVIHSVACGRRRTVLVEALQRFQIVVQPLIHYDAKKIAPTGGLEPPTTRLRAVRSTD